MRIEAQILKDYIKKITMNKNILTFNLNFTEDEVTSSLKGTSNVTMTLGKLFKDAFETYEAIGEIFIRNSILMTTMLSTFKDVIHIEKVGDYALKISEDDREVYIMLAEESVCDNVVKKEKPILDFKLKMDLTKSDLTPIIKDMNILKSPKIYMVNKDKRMTFKIGEESESDYTKKFITTISDEEIKVSVGEYINYFYEALTDKFTLNIGNDLPLLFVESTPLMKIETYIAPMVD